MTDPSFQRKLEPISSSSVGPKKMDPGLRWGGEAFGGFPEQRSEEPNCARASSQKPSTCSLWLTRPSAARFRG
jgi:hypothetical protein